MHLAFLNLPIEFYSPVSGGAVATVIMQLTQELERRGHQVSVLSATDGQPAYASGRLVPLRGATREALSWWQRRLSGLRQRFAPWDWPYYEHHLASFRQELARLRPAPEVVIAHNDLVAPWFIRQVLPQAQIWAWLHNEQGSRWPRLAAALPCVDRFVAVSEYIRRWSIARHGLSPERVSTILNGVDLETFTTGDRRAPDVGEPLRVLALGRIDPNKGPDLAADAVAALRREGVPVRLTVAGPQWWHGGGWEDPYFTELKGKMAAAGADYRGHVPRAGVPALLREHDVVCVLSRSQEPFGLVALEAMACGCAVIASPRGGLPEACGGAATLIDPDEPAALVAALRRHAEDRPFLSRQSHRSEERAREASWARRVDIMETLLPGSRKEALAA